MDVLQKEIDEVYATQLIADEILDNGVVEQHQRFIHSVSPRHMRPSQLSPIEPFLSAYVNSIRPLAGA